MADIYIANSIDEGWKVWNAASNAWQNASLQDLLNATHQLNVTTGNYDPVDFKRSYNKGDKSGPVEWNAVKNIWQLKADKRVSPAVQNAGNNNHVIKTSEISVIDADAVEELLQKIKEIVNRAPDYREEINQLRKSLKKTVEEALRDELRGIVWDDLAKELRDDVENELRIDLEEEISTELRINLEVDVRSELKKELREKVWKSLYDSFEQNHREEIEEEIRDLVYEELSDQVKLTEHEISDIKNKLRNKLKSDFYESTRDAVIKELTEQFRSALTKDANAALEKAVRDELLHKIQLTASEIEVRKEELYQILMQKEKAALENRLKDEVRNELGKKMIDEVRRNLAKSLRDSVIKELRISLRNEVEGLLRTELTIDFAKEIAESGSEYVGAIVNQSRFHIQRELENRITDHCIQNAVILIQEVLRTSGVNYEVILEVSKQLRDLSPANLLINCKNEQISIEQPVYEQI